METPEERRAKAITNIMKEKDEGGDSSNPVNDDNDLGDLYGNSSCRRDDPKTRIGVDGSNGRVKQEKGFSWTQTTDELEVVVVIPNSGTSTAVVSKDVQVTFRARGLLVSYQNETLVDIQLFEEIDIDTSTWTLDKSSNHGTKLIITLEKLEQALWIRIQD